MILAALDLALSATTQRMPPLVKCECIYIHIEITQEHSYTVDFGTAVLSSAPADASANATASTAATSCDPYDDEIYSDYDHESNTDSGDLMLENVSASAAAQNTDILGVPLDGHATSSINLGLTSGSSESFMNATVLSGNIWEGNPPSCDALGFRSGLAVGMPASVSTKRWVFSTPGLASYASTMDWDCTWEIGYLIPDDPEEICGLPPAPSTSMIRIVIMRGLTIKSGPSRSLDLLASSHGAIAFKEDGDVIRLGHFEDTQFDPTVVGDESSMSGVVSLSLDSTDLDEAEEIEEIITYEVFYGVGNANRDENDRISWPDRTAIITHLGTEIGDLDYDIRSDIDLNGYVDVYDLFAFNALPCNADFNDDEFVDINDFLDYFNAYGNEDPIADMNGDTVIDILDQLDFFDAFGAGC
jgi:hypothetical protein